MKTYIIQRRFKKGLVFWCLYPTKHWSDNRAMAYPFTADKARQVAAELKASYPPTSITISDKLIS